MLREIKFIMIILVFIGSFSLLNLIAEAAHPVPDISIEYGVATEVAAGQVVHLPGPSENSNGTSGLNGYGHVTMPTDLPDQTLLTVSEVADVDTVTNSNGEELLRCGEVYSFNLETPEGTSYGDLASIALPYCNGLSDLDIYSLDDSNNWTKQNGNHNESFNDYTAQVSLGTHGVFSAERIGEDEEELVEDQDTNGEEIGNGVEEDEDTNGEETDDATETNEDKCSDDMQITINLDEETNVCANQTIDIADTMNQIVMPTDLPENTTLTVMDVGESVIVTEAKGLYRGGDVLEFILTTPEGSEFTGNFELKMPYGNGVSVDDIFYYNEETEQWDAQGAEFDYDDFTLNTELSHLSTYGVFGIDEEDESTKEEVTKKNEEDDTNIKEESSKEDDSSEIAVSVEEDKDKKGGLLPSTATGIFNWVLVGGVLIIIGFAFFIINKRKSSNT